MPNPEPSYLGKLAAGWEMFLAISSQFREADRVHGVSRSEARLGSTEIAPAVLPRTQTTDAAKQAREMRGIVEADRPGDLADPSVSD